MADILDGRIARNTYKKALIERSKKLSARPTLALIQIGNNAESTIYIEQKKKFARDIDVLVEHVQCTETTPFEEIEKKIQSFNARQDIHGIIIQLPIPKTLDVQKLLNTIDPKKDVDGLTDTNQKLLEQGTPGFIPATAKGVVSLLEFYNISVAHKKVVVFGKSRLVGGPIASLLKAQGAEVSVCHSQTINPREISKQADIVIVAIGRPEYIDASYIRPGAVIIDVGINDISGKKLEEEITKRRIVGDVKHKSVETLAKAISPVPGGVGPMTVLSLFDNLILSAEH